MSSMSRSDDLGNVGERTLGVPELVEDHVVGLTTCEGGLDVVGVEALLGGVAQVVFHGVKVVGKNVSRYSIILLVEFGVLLLLALLGVRDEKLSRNTLR